MIESITAVLAINALGFGLGYALQTDKFTDIIYSLSFIVVVVTGWMLAGTLGAVQTIVGVMVMLWGLRLGGYLFYRIHKMGKDERFDDMRPSIWRFLGFWTLQVISIIIIALPVMIIMTKSPHPYSWTLALGGVIWIIGFVTETVADWQKFRFKQQAGNKNSFMRTGLWSIVRHPNYLGEILVWIGIFIACIPLLAGIEWLAIASPVWIFVLLRYISGIPLLEERAKKKYGDLPEYQEYVQNTPRLLPGA